MPSPNRQSILRLYQPCRLFKLLLIFLFYDHVVEAFAASHPQQQHSRSTTTTTNKDDNGDGGNTIGIRIATTPHDMMGLADLRYNEWILTDTSQTAPSRMAFHCATAEIQQERIDEHAVTFVAYDNEGTTQTSSVVGAAELSPIELQGCFPYSNSHSNIHNNYQYWYVTDVVTSRTHRRRGIAAKLMNRLEEQAVLEATKVQLPSPQHQAPKRKIAACIFLLHVKPDNTPAINFYQSLGYQIISSPIPSLSSGNSDSVLCSEYLQDLDDAKLAENAGVQNQLLFCKKVINLDS